MTEPKFEPFNVNARMKISALWTSMLFVFAYALTIIASALGEWTYYVFGSAIEIALLAGIVYDAWTWPKEAPATSVDLL